MTMNFGAEYKERKQQLQRRNKEDVVIPLSDLPGLSLRLNKDAAPTKQLIDQLVKGDTSQLPAELFVEDEHGAIGINVSAYRRPGIMRRLNEVEGAVSFFRDIHRDATLKGERTFYTEGFRDARRLAQHKTADLTRQYINGHVDRENELAISGRLSHIESQETQESFRHIESFAQSVVDRLFLASGIKKFKPKVYLTKSEEKNAFVLTQDTGNTFKEYVSSASDDQPMELPVYIHTGLVRTFKTEDELAGVLAHEFAHLLQPNYIDDKDESLQKRLEYDADAQGMRLADAAGFNPRGIIEVMKQFNRSVDRLDIIMSSSHPATEKRIIELEKLFHRTDVPLPNAVKAMTGYAEELVASLKNTKLYKLQKKHLPIQELEQSGTLEQTLREVKADPEVFLDGNNYSVVEVLAERRVIELYKDYELATGAFGYRDKLLASLDDFLLVLNRPQKEGESLHVEIPDVEGKITDIEMPQVSDTTFATTQNPVLPRVIYEQEMQTRNYGLTQLGIDTESHVSRTLDEWISDDERTILFWEAVQKKFYFDRPLSRGEKLYCLRSWIKDNDQNYSSVKCFKITKTVEEIKRIPKMPDLKDVSVLNNLPLLGGRVHKKKEDEKIPEIEYTEQKIYTQKGIHTVRVEKEPRLFAPVWEKDEKKIPPAIQELAEIQQEQSALAYQTLLQERGFGELSLDAAKYIIRSIRQFKEYGPLIEDAEHKHITFFDEVIRAADFQKLKNLGDASGYGFGGDISLVRLKKTCIAAIGFLLVPRNEEEREMKRLNLRRVESDPILSFEREFKIEFSGLPEGGSISDRHLIKGKKDNQDILVFESENIPGIASRERVFVEYGATIGQYAETGDFNGEESPSWFIYSQEKETRKDRLRTSLFGENDVVEKIKRITDGENVSLDVAQEKIDRFITILTGLATHVSRSELVNMTQVKKLLEQQEKFCTKNHRTWNFFVPFIQEYAKKLSEELMETSGRWRKKFEGRDDYMVQRLEEVLWGAFRDQYSYQDILKQTREIQLIEQKKSGKVVDDSLRPIPKTPEESLAWFIYRPKDVSLSKVHGNGEQYPTLETASVLAYLRQEGLKNPSIGELQKVMQGLAKKQQKLPQAILILALGQLPDFSDVWVGGEFPIEDTIKVFQQAREVYGADWQHLERFKRLDEQLSLWEWKFANPLIPDTFSVSDKKKDKKEKDESLVLFIDHTFSYKLSDVYQIDRTHLDKQEFSWPLFLQDLYDDTLDREKIMPYEQESGQKEKWGQALDLLRTRLIDVIADTKNIEKVKGMQPGFFKEFILHEKMKRMGDLSLEQIESFAGQFTAFSHEGSKRNQLEGIIELSKKELVKNKKLALLKQAGRDLGLSEEDAEKLHLEETPYRALSDRDIAIMLRVENVSHNALYTRFQELLHEEELRIGERECTPEEDVHVFSDQIIENGKSKIQIGPVYRLRWMSQPLMDWHAQALEAAQTPEESRALFLRIEKDLPEKHPLRDMFVKNQLATDIWQLLKKNTANPEALGFTFTKKKINIDEALAAYPLHAEASFLKDYTLFAVDGLVEHAEDIPEQCVDALIQMIEAVVEDRISPDQHPALRRLLFVLEQKIRWPQLKQERKNNGQVFDTYIDRIQHFYPDPSLEKDDILEKIGMDLAYTAEQIKAVWGLRYEEQTRWADDMESRKKKNILEGAERTRLAIAKMSSLDRVQYMLWMLGGKTPLVELLSSEVSNISLNQRKDALWVMTPTERRHALYELFMGEKGILTLSYAEYTDDLSDEELENKKKSERSWGYNQERELDKTLPRIERPSDQIRYVVDNIFEQTFGDQALDPAFPNEHPTNVRGRELMHTVFRELFLQQKDPARRTELMINIVEAVGKNKHEGKSLTPGELMKLLLEQIGVVGVKVAQVLSEQPGLLPESIQRELATLKDQASTFSKRGILAYLEAGGWVNGEDSKMETIGDCIGSASIKQVMEGRTKDGQTVAIKAKRPSIDKNFSEDMDVLKAVLAKVEEKGFDVPSYLINEVRDIVLEELSFIHEADNQMAMKASLGKRQASLRIPIAGRSVEVPLSISAPLSVSEVLYPAAETKEDIGLMVEQYVRGFSLKQMQDYQRALRDDDESSLKKFREKITQLYDKTRVKEIEQKIGDMDIDMLQAQLAIDLLKQVTQDGVFHADLHGGNFYMDFNPIVQDGTLHEMQGIFIDLGSVGYSKFDAMPQYQQEINETNFNTSEDFRDFISALFTIDIMQEGASRKIASLVKKYAGLNCCAASRRG